MFDFMESPNHIDIFLMKINQGLLKDPEPYPKMQEVALVYLLVCM